MIIRLVRGHGAAAALILAVLVSVGYLLLWPVSLGGDTTYVTVHGSSMEPRFHSGDLAVLRSTGSYAAGDVVAYRSHDLHTTVMHRIVSVRNGRYVFKGDHNSFLDPEQPTSSQLVGTLVLRVPQWSRGVSIATGPIALTALALALTLGGGRSVRHKIRRKRGTMSRIAPPLNRGTFGFLRNMPRPLAIATTVTSTAVGLSGVLLVLAWTAPVDTTSAGHSGQFGPAGRQAVFSYTATVRPSAAYDGTTATSPDPIFRTVAKTVDVHLAYTGSPGTVEMQARLSNTSGWHSTVELARAAAVGRRADTTVALDLDALQARSDAAAKATGYPPGQVNISLWGVVRSPGLPAFTPTVKLVLAPLALTLAGNPSSLTVMEPTQGSTAGPPTKHVVTLAGHTFDASSAQALALWVLVACALSFGLIVVLARRGFAASEGVRIRRRYGPLMVPVEPMTFSPGRPVVTVTDITTLVKLAERYRLLVLHWERSGIETFVVQDENTTYCFRTGATAADRATRPSPVASDLEVTTGATLGPSPRR